MLLTRRQWNDASKQIQATLTNSSNDTLGNITINIFRTFGLDLTQTCKYGRLPFMCFDMLTMSISFHAHDFNTFHVRNLSLARQDVRSQAHVFGCQLVAVDHQIPIGSARSIAKPFHEVVGTSRKHLFRQR